MLAGVAGGIARRLDIPAWVVRAAFIVLTVGGGFGVALYIAFWLLVPRDDELEPLARTMLERVQGGSGWVGVILIGVGVAIAAGSVGFIRGDLAVAVFLGVVGVLLYRGELGRGADSAASNPGENTGEGAPPPPATTAGALVDTPAGTTVVERPRPPAQPPSILGRLTMAVTLIALGVLAWFDYALASFDPTPRHYFGLALGLVGLALVVGSWVGRARGLIILGIVLIPALAAAPLAELDFRSGVGQRTIAPDAVGELQGAYELSMGEMVVDLRRVDFSGHDVALDVQVGIGSLRVIVPPEVGLDATGEVGVGEVSVFGASSGGFGRQMDADRAGDGHLTLDARTGMGEVIIDADGGGFAFIHSIAETVVSPDQLRAEYTLDVGNITLDLSDLTLQARRRVTVATGAGDIRIIVPDADVAIVNAHAGFGGVDLYGNVQKGVDVDMTTSGSAPLLTLDVSVDAGQIIVEEAHS